MDRRHLHRCESCQEVARFEQFGVLRADRKRQAVFEGVQINEVAQDVALDRLQNAAPLLSSRLKRFVRQKPFRRLPARERSSMMFVSYCVRGSRGRIDDVVAEAVARQLQVIDDVDHRIRVQPRVLVGGGRVVDHELDRAGDALREVRTRSVGERQVLAAALRIGLRVVVLDEDRVRRTR